MDHPDPQRQGLSDLDHGHPVRSTHAPRSIAGALMTSMLLAAGTVGVAGVVATILPVSGTPTLPRREASPVVASLKATPKRATMGETAGSPGASEPRYVLPRVLERLARTAAQAAARVEHLADRQAFTDGPPVAFAAPPPASATYSVLAAPAADPQRIVYLIDASGSLLDSLPQVIDWLGESLDALQPNHRFTVLFFREGRVFEAPPRGLKPASFAAKATVWSWVQPEKGNVTPEGRSDLLSAVEVAMNYRPDELIIVSDDSFNRSTAYTGDDSAILRRISARLGRTPPRVNTVQFFYRDEAGALEAIADRFGGEYFFIAPTDRNATAVADPLLELSLFH